MASLLIHDWIMFVLIAGMATLSLGLHETKVGFGSFESCKTPSGHDGKRYNCYDNMCWCTRTKADCSRNYGNLTFIPRLPPGITFLDFSHNDLELIPEDFFANVTSITILSLSTNSITNISDGALASLTRLEVLIMDHNFNLTQPSLKPVFEVKTLRCVDVRHGKLKAFPENLFEDHAMPNLQQLIFFGNYIELANLSMFQHLPRLRTIDWGANDVFQLLGGHLNTLENIYLEDNRLYSFPGTCDENSTPFYPRLALLNLAQNHLHAIPSVVCLPELELLDLSGNLLPILYTDMFSSARFGRLTYLYLEHMGTQVQHIEDYAFSTPTLRKISLMFNNIHFSKGENVSFDSFAGCPNLETLQLSHTVFGGVSGEKFLRLFGNLTQLHAIYLGGSELEQITASTFARFPNLTTLQLYMNKITEIPDGAFDGNPHLSLLQLNDNRIKTIREATFSEATRKVLKVLDLSGNPFQCDCDLRWFSDWMRSNRSVFSHSRSSYNCTNLPRTRVASFHMADQACFLTRTTSKFIVAIVAILILTGTLVSSLFRYRWHLRLVLYEAFRGRGDVRRRRLAEGNFVYDVFVSYDSEDLHWVREHLMPELEDRLGLRLCVHERDFIPGNNIVDNIAECVESSKKVLMVFSKDFLRSQWCQFELAFCLSHVMDYDDTLIVACLDDVASRALTSAMMAVMKTTTYIQWAEHPDARASFWGRLQIALREIAPNADE